MSTFSAISRTARRAYATTAKSGFKGRNVVLVDGVRTPFQLSGTGFNKLQAHDLGRLAISGLLNRNDFDAKLIDAVYYGTVIQETKTSNIARECALSAGIPNSTPAYTVTLACISSNLAINEAANAISVGQADIVVAGGTETMSDVPIRVGRSMRAKLLGSQKLKTPAQMAGWVAGLKAKDFSLELPAIAEFSTGEVMGHSADRLCAAFGVSRLEQDEFAIRSHTLAKQASDKGLLTDRIPVKVPGSDKFITEDNGVRVGTIEKLSSLKAAFYKPYGSITAANASFLTDGASASLLMAEETALKLGLKPKAYIRDTVFVAQDPNDELLLGPAYATPKILSKMGLTMKDIDVFEYHEAFAGQILACMKALDSDKFGREKFGLNGKNGLPDMDKMNKWGGSLSLGHPFGATGSRLVNTAANRLIAENGRYALLSACAAGGHAVGSIIERYP